MTSFNYTEPVQRSHVVYRSEARRRHLSTVVFTVCALLSVGAMLGVFGLAFAVGFGL